MSKIPKSLEEYIEDGKEMWDNGYRLKDRENYKSTNSILTFICPKGHSFQRTAKDFLKYKSCPTCKRRSRIGIEDFLKGINNANNNLPEGEYYKLSNSVEEIENTKTKYPIIHYLSNGQSHTFESSYDNFVNNGRRCPKCRTSKATTVAKNKNTKTTDEFKQDLIDAKCDITLLSEYTHARELIKFKCNVCGTIKEMQPHNILKSIKNGINVCTNCRDTDKTIKKTSNIIKPVNSKATEKYKEKILSLVGDEYSVQGEYINSKTKILMKHNTCGYEWEIDPSHFCSMGNRCPKCSKNTKTTEQFRKEVKELVGDDYTVLGEYINNSTDILMKHSCGYEYNVIPVNFLTKGTARCPICNGTNRKYTPEEYRKIVYNLVGDEYSVLGDYIDTKTKIKMRHNTCGNIVYIAPDHFKGHNGQIGTRCRFCKYEKLHNKFSMTTEDFKNYVKEETGDEYSVLGKYYNGETNIKMKHNTCGHEYMVKPSNFKYGKRCPKCNSSKGEMRISKLLEKFSIKYETEKRFPDCKDKRPLPFDFYLPDYNTCIEFDGIQHFQESVYYNEDELKDRKLKDEIKNKYCIDNEINLIRLDYTNFNTLEKDLVADLTELEII